MTDYEDYAHVRNRATGRDISDSEVAGLVELHRCLVEGLAQLDQIGEHAGGAYLAAAVDVIENRLTAIGQPVESRHGGVLAQFAHGLSDRLGDRAVDVARAQLMRAEGTTLVVWTAIVNELERIRTTA